MNGEQGSLRSLIDRAWHPGGLLSDYRAASDHMDGDNDRTMADRSYGCTAHSSKYCECCNEPEHDGGPSSDSDLCSSASKHDGGSDSEPTPSDSEPSELRAASRLTSVLNYDAIRDNLQLTIRL